MLILIGLASIAVSTVAPGYFVAPEIAYVAVDRGRPLEEIIGEFDDETDPSSAPP
jgi:CBS domain containing-hemolysin-like protein